MSNQLLGVNQGVTSNRWPTNFFLCFSSWVFREPFMCMMEKVLYLLCLIKRLGYVLLNRPTPHISGIKNENKGVTLYDCKGYSSYLTSYNHVYEESSQMEVKNYLYRKMFSQFLQKISRIFYGNHVFCMDSSLHWLDLLSKTLFLYNGVYWSI